MGIGHDLALGPLIPREVCRCLSCHDLALWIYGSLNEIMETVDMK